MSESCENCKFWRYKGEVGDCRRYPPQIVVYDELDGQLLKAYPKTEPLEWCGEWQPKK